MREMHFFRRGAFGAAKCDFFAAAPSAPRNAFFAAAPLAP
jgi:hypothetical protein